MQLLKIRNFSTFFSDTFKFIRENGKHFFTNYFIINGVFLLITLLKNYNTEIGSFSFVFEMVFALFSMIFGLINWTFVTIYMILYNKLGTNFNYRDILNYYKENIGKIIIFILVSILLAIPAIIIFYIAFFISIITLIGPFLVYASFIIWFTLAFYEYLNTDKPVFDCFGYSFTLFTKKFWATTGSTALLLVIIGIIYGFALGILGIFSSFMDMNKSGDALNTYVKTLEAFSAPKVLVVMTFLSILYVLLQISQGIIYFSQKELLENISANKTIDEIGKIEE